MPERLKQIPKKLQEIWKKYTAKQRAIIISTMAVVVLALIVLIVVLNQTEYEKLVEFDNTATAKSAMAILDENSIDNRLASDNKTVEVSKKQKQAAVLALADSEIVSQDKFTLQNLLDSDGMGTTSADKNRNLHLYTQSELNEKISKWDGIDKASVIYFPSDKSKAILRDQKDIGASVLLTTNDKFDKVNTPVAVATAVAYAIGDSTTDKIKVIDQHGRLLFGGESNDPENISAEAALSYEKTVEKWYMDKLYELCTINGYYNAEVIPHLKVNMEQTSQKFTEYIATEGLQSPIDSYTKISSENEGAAGDIPGTDSNDETDYYIQNQGSGNSSYNEETYKFKPSERVTETLRTSPYIDHKESSLAVTLRKSIQISEEQLEEEGALEGTTFERYVETHPAELTPITDQEQIDSLKQLFSDASGIDINRITITAYTEPFYIPKPVEEGMNFSLILEILLAALIIGLLLFVVFRAMKPQEVIETEPELSVERLLATTRENQSLEDIEFGEKSETRKMIEKYIDENAEAVAALLRNWLNDDGWD